MPTKYQQYKDIPRSIFIRRIIEWTRTEGWIFLRPRVTSRLERVCKRCGLTRTYVAKDGYEKWYRRKTGGWWCKQCWTKRYYLAHDMRDKAHVYYKKVVRPKRLQDPKYRARCNRKQREAYYMRMSNPELRRKYNQYHKKYYHRVVKAKKRAWRLALWKAQTPIGMVERKTYCFSSIWYISTRTITSTELMDLYTWGYFFHMMIPENSLHIIKYVDSFH